MYYENIEVSTLKQFIRVIIPAQLIVGLILTVIVIFSEFTNESDKILFIFFLGAVFGAFSAFVFVHFALKNS